MFTVEGKKPANPLVLASKVEWYCPFPFKKWTLTEDAALSNHRKLISL